MYRTLLVALVVLVALLAGCGAKPPTTDLRIPINVRCSTCTDYIRCDKTSGNVEGHNPDFSLYELQAKGPGTDITTITEYFLQFIEPKTSHTRPLAVYAQTVTESGQPGWHTSTDHTATIDVASHRIGLPDGWIDQQNGEWHDKHDSLQGTCRILDRQEGQRTASLFMEKAQ